MLPALCSHEQYVKLANKLIENIHVPSSNDNSLLMGWGNYLLIVMHISPYFL